MFGAFRATWVRLKSPVVAKKPWTPGRLANKKKSDKIKHRNLRLLRQGEDAIHHLNEQASRLEGKPRSKYTILKSSDKQMMPPPAAFAVHKEVADFPGKNRFRVRGDFREWEDMKEQSP
mmetsp:Transcript_669/g.2239  ORF Transcript_669/g.2239 Transcript_669/m.2239 type:complete len:119 (-) Transcript_669:94-450(-)